MSKKVPRADNLRASREWVRLKFGMHGQYRGALRQVDRSLAAIQEYERSFLLCKASLLSCLERWAELAALLGQLAERYPGDLEVRNDIAEFFMAHGDWQSCLAVLDLAKPLLRSSSDNLLVDHHYDTRLTCLYALGHKKRAIRQGQSVLKRLPRNSVSRTVLRNIQSGRLRIAPWAPKSASYLRELRRLSSREHR
jgi:tetratricopeptide (TPR) repeat protein